MTDFACSRRRWPMRGGTSPSRSARSGQLPRLGLRKLGGDPSELPPAARLDELPVELLVALDQLEDLVVDRGEPMSERLAVTVDRIDAAPQPSQAPLPGQAGGKPAAPGGAQRAPVGHPRDSPAGRSPESAAVVIDEVPVDAELERMGVHLVRPKQRVPLDAPLLQQAEEVPTDVGDPLALLIQPLVAAAPIAWQVEPQGGSHRTEERMGLRVAVVLVAPHRDQRIAVELLPQEGDDGRDRKGVAVDEDDDVVGLSGVGDEISQDRQLELMLPERNVGAVEELRGVITHAVVEPGVDPVRLVDVPLEVSELNIDPAVVGPVDGGDVNHGGRGA